MYKIPSTREKILPNDIQKAPDNNLFFIEVKISFQT